MTLSLYWCLEPPCYVIAEDAEDVLKVMEENWGSDHDRDAGVDPVLVPSPTLVALDNEEFDPAGAMPMGPGVRLAEVMEIRPASYWVGQGRGILVEFEP